MSERPPAKTLFARLRDACAPEWRRYCEHPFVAGMADGSLSETAFRYYLEQDYLFLLHFARAYGLAVFKSESLADMRAGAAGISAILDTEIDLHVSYCASWGIARDAMEAMPEDPACMAYTRYVMERGVSGDLLDLHVALAPCVVGYAEIGARLAADPGTKRAGNPYDAWIGMYANEDYQALASDHIVLLDDLFARRAGEGRLASLTETFRAATVLEERFWQMGLDGATTRGGT